MKKIRSCTTYRRPGRTSPRHGWCSTRAMDLISGYLILKTLSCSRCMRVFACWQELNRRDVTLRANAPLGYELPKGRRSTPVGMEDERKLTRSPKSQRIRN